MEFVIPQHLNLDSSEQNLFLWVIRPFWRDTKTLFRCSMSGWQTPIYFEVKRGDFSNIPGNAILSATYIHLSEDPLAQYLNYSRNLRAMTGSRVIPQKSKFLSLSLCHPFIPLPFFIHLRCETTNCDFQSLISQVLIYLPSLHSPPQICWNGVALKSRAFVFGGWIWLGLG